MRYFPAPEPAMLRIWSPMPVVEGEAVFPLREAEAPELNVDVLASLPGLFHSEEGGLSHWDGAAVKVGARV